MDSLSYNIVKTIEEVLPNTPKIKQCNIYTNSSDPYLIAIILLLTLFMTLGVVKILNRKHLRRLERKRNKQEQQFKMEKQAAVKEINELIKLNKRRGNDEKF